jgi:hypothetical protein
VEQHPAIPVRDQLEAGAPNDIERDSVGPTQ